MSDQNSSNHHVSPWLVGGLAAGVVIGLDQLTKTLASTSVINADLAWSLTFGWLSPWGRSIVIFLIIGLLFLLARWHLRLHPSWQRAGLYGLLLGAALSNWLDRVWLGGVRDIWYLPGLNIWNNLADWVLVLSVMVLIVSDIQETRRVQQSQTA